MSTYVPSRTLPVRVELVRQLRRRRTQIVFGLVVALPVILWIAFTLAPAGPPSNSVSLVDLAKGSGANFAVFALFASASFLLVVVVALFFGDTVAAEASWSSLRYLLAAPVPRSRLVRQKAIVAAMLSVAAILLLPIVALVVGALAYGTGDLVSPTGESLTFLQGAGRVLLGAVYLSLYLSWTAALALLLSVSTDAPLGAVGGAVLVSILSPDPRPDHRAGGAARLPPDPLRQRLVGPARDADRLGGHDPRRLLRVLLRGGVLRAGDLAVRPEGRHELMAGAKETRDGVELTSLDGPAFDGADATKRDLVDYLDAVADRIVPELAQRPLSVVRVRPGQPPFMQKNLPKYAPGLDRAHVGVGARLAARGRLRAVRRPAHAAVVRQPAGRRIPPEHVAGRRAPRGTARAGPRPAAGGRLRRRGGAARLVRAALAELGLAAAVKTSGAKGLHVIVPLAGEVALDDAAAATRAVAARAAALDPDVATTAFIKEDRAGKVFVDPTRAGGATLVAVYSPRARPGAPVSFPVAWDDLDAVKPADFTVRTALAALGDGDPWPPRCPPRRPCPPSW